MSGTGGSHLQGSPFKNAEVHTSLWLLPANIVAIVGLLWPDKLLREADLSPHSWGSAHGVQQPAGSMIQQRAAESHAVGGPACCYSGMIVAMPFQVSRQMNISMHVTSEAQQL